MFDFIQRIVNPLLKNPTPIEPAKPRPIIIDATPHGNLVSVNIQRDYSEEAQRTQIDI